jgi:DNA-binding beta-propeller fold protein YncE
VWVVSGGNNRLWRIEPATGPILTSVATGSEPSAIAADDRHVWVGSQTGDIYEVDAESNTLTRSVRVAHPVLALAVIDGRLWVSVGS